MKWPGIIAGVLGLAAGFESAAVAAGDEPWTVSPPAGARKGCVLESAPVPIHDGYLDGTVRILVDDAGAARVIASSVLDGAFKDIGLRVDNGEFIAMDRIDAQRTAVFDASHGKIVEEFRRGREAVVDLRFWPTWPTTGVHSASFSLIGFTKAFGELAGCR